MGMPTFTRPAVAATRQANKRRTRPTATVAPTEGVNNGLPATLGTVALLAAVGRSAMRKCHRANATKARLTTVASVVFMGDGGVRRHLASRRSLVRRAPQVVQVTPANRDSTSLGG